MKALSIVLCLITGIASGQSFEYLRITQIAFGQEPSQRRKIKFDFGSKYDSSSHYQSGLQNAKSIVDAIEHAEKKGWTYVETDEETAGSVVVITMRRRKQSR
jgi:hypothetical protein